MGGKEGTPSLAGGGAPGRRGKVGFPGRCGSGSGRGLSPLWGKGTGGPVLTVSDDAITSLFQKQNVLCDTNEEYGLGEWGVILSNGRT